MTQSTQNIEAKDQNLKVSFLGLKLTSDYRNEFNKPRSGSTFLPPGSGSACEKSGSAAPGPIRKPNLGA